eukprot:75655-Amphidinium_carterae.1
MSADSSQPSTTSTSARLRNLLSRQQPFLLESKKPFPRRSMAESFGSLHDVVCLVQWACCSFSNICAESLPSAFTVLLSFHKDLRSRTHDELVQSFQALKLPTYIRMLSCWTGFAPMVLEWSSVFCDNVGIEC